MPHALVLQEGQRRVTLTERLTVVKVNATVLKMGRPAHPNRHIEAALGYAEDRGWRVEKAGPRAHAWGRMYCGVGHSLHQMSIWGTPRNPENHARSIRRFVDQCAIEEET